MKAVRIIGGFLLLILIIGSWFSNLFADIHYGATEILIRILGLGVAIWGLYTGFQMKKNKMEKE